MLDVGRGLSTNHFRREGGVRPPLGRSPGRGLLQHLVDLLERQALGLGNEEVAVDQGRQAQSAPNEEDARLHVGVTLFGTDHIRGDDSDDGVPQPVGRSRQGNTAGADGQGEDLADEDPRAGTPGGGEEEDEDGNEGDLCIDGGDVVGDGDGGVAGTDRVSLVETDGHTDNADNEETDAHAGGAENQNGATAEFLDSVERDRGRADVDESEDQGDEEGVADGAGGLEEGCGVVEDEVDTSPLLHHLERSAQDGKTQVGVAPPQATLEAVGPRSEPGGVGDKLALVLLVGDNLSKLNLNVLGLAGLATETGERVGGFVQPAALDKVTGRVGQEDQATSQNGTPDELDANGDSVSLGATDAFGAVYDTRGEQQSDGDAELVASDEGATDLAGALFE